MLQSISSSFFRAPATTSSTKPSKPSIISFALQPSFLRLKKLPTSITFTVTSPLHHQLHHQHQLHHHSSRFTIFAPNSPPDPKKKSKKRGKISMRQQKRLEIRYLPKNFKRLECIDRGFTTPTGLRHHYNDKHKKHLPKLPHECKCGARTKTLEELKSHKMTCPLKAKKFKQVKDSVMERRRTRDKSKGKYPLLAPQEEEKREVEQKVEEEGGEEVEF